MTYKNSLLVLEATAKKCIAEIGGLPENWLAVAVQLIIEKGYPYWEGLAAGLKPETKNGLDYNIGNNKVETKDGLQFAKPSTLDEGTTLYCQTFLHDPAEYYVNVVHAFRKGTNDDVLKALSESPYCSPPYPLWELNSILDHLEIVFGLQTVTIPEPSTRTSVDKSLEESTETKAQETVEDGEEWVTITAEPPFNTLWGIATKYEGHGQEWVNYRHLNPGLDPLNLREGDKIRIR